MNLEKQLRSLVKDAETIDDYLNAFEKFHEYDCGDEDEVSFFEADNFGSDAFCFELKRQYKGEPDDDEYIQVHLDIFFEPIREADYEIIWSDEFEDIHSFIESVRSSAAYKYIVENDLIPKKVDIYAEET